MTIKKISSTHVDPMGIVVNNLSKVSETISSVQNALMDTRFVGFTTSMNSMSVPYGGLVGGCGNPQWDNSSYKLNIEDSGKYPVIDIVNDEIPDPDDVKHSVPVYRVDVYAAGVPKENISVHLEEGNFVGTTFYPPKMNIRIAKNETKEQKTESFIYKESKHSYTNRIISLPEDADVFNTTEAILENGVLSFKIRKTVKPKTPTQLVTINIK